MKNSCQGVSAAATPGPAAAVAAAASGQDGGTGGSGRSYFGIIVQPLRASAADEERPVELSSQ